MVELISNVQTHVSASRPAQKESPRVPRPDENSRRPQSPVLPPKEGPLKAYGLVPFHLRPHERIRLDHDVEAVRSQGLRLAHGWLILYVRDRGDGNPSRRLVVRVARKAGIAVTRNRLRRLLREVFRHEKENLKPSVDTLAVIQPFPGARKLGYEDLRVKWIRLFKRSGLYLEQVKPILSDVPPHLNPPPQGGRK